MGNSGCINWGATTRTCGAHSIDVGGGGTWWGGGGGKDPFKESNTEVSQVGGGGAPMKEWGGGAIAGNLVPTHCVLHWRGGAGTGNISLIRVERGNWGRLTMGDP